MPNIINTRIQLKYDTLSNWFQSSLGTNPFKPLKGEICIAEIPGGTNDSGLTPPSIGIKVGDENHTFRELPWIQAVAGDVHGWAKAETKPDYNASEIAATERNGTTNGSTVQAILTAVQNSLASLTGGESGQSIAGQITAAIQNLDYSDTAETGKFVTSVSETDGVISVVRDNIAIVDIVGLQNALDAKQDNLTFNGTYDSSTNKVATESTVSNAIAALDYTATGMDAGKTIATLTETDGIIAATFQDIEIGLNQVSDAGEAAAKDVDTAIDDNSTSANYNGTSTDLPTTAAVVGYIQAKTAGLTGAMHYKGTVAAIPPASGTYESGDVVLLTGTSKEYIYDGTSWTEFGDEGSYALKTRAISAGDGLTGGGTLEADRTIAHAIPNGATAGAQGGTSGTRTYIQSITTDKFGHITGVTTEEETVINTTYTFEEGTVDGAFSVTPSNGSAQSVTIHGLGDAAYADLAANGVANGDDGLVTADEVYDHTTGIVNGLTGSAIATAANGNIYSVLTGVSETNGIISKTSEVTLAAIAKTGSIYDTIETETAYSSNASGEVQCLIFNCGSSTELV